jgi:uncharacterized membrane protein (DUF485 family)
MNEHTAGETRNARAGIVLFVVYVLFYAAFVALSAFAPKVMASEIGGVNLAILYGFGLIVLAFVLAMVYMFVTRGNGDRDGGADGEGRA